MKFIHWIVVKCLSLRAYVVLFSVWRKNVSNVFAKERIVDLYLFCAFKFLCVLDSPIFYLRVAMSLKLIVCIISR